LPGPQPAMTACSAFGGGPSPRWSVEDNRETEVNLNHQP
jgi:hypothetical protein